MRVLRAPTILAELLSSDQNEKYSHVMNHIRVRLRFALLRSVLIALRGERGRFQKPDNSNENISFNMIPTAKSYESP